MFYVPFKNFIRIYKQDSFVFSIIDRFPRWTLHLRTWPYAAKWTNSLPLRNFTDFVLFMFPFFDFTVYVIRFMNIHAFNLHCSFENKQCQEISNECIAKAMWPSRSSINSIDQVINRFLSDDLNRFTPRSWDIPR